MKISYRGIHSYVGRHFQPYQGCDLCRTTEIRKYEWAEKTPGKHSRERNDWMRLCVPCHSRYDGKTGAKRPKEICLKISKSLKGKHKSLSHRLKLSIAHKGKSLSPEHRQKLSEYLLKHPRKPWLGKKLSQEHRANISSNMTGLKRGHYSPEHRFKIGNAWRGKKMNETIRAKMKESQRLRRIREKENFEM